MRFQTLLLAAAATLGAQSAASAAPILAAVQEPRDTDKIYLTDGTILKDVGVLSEGLVEIEYRTNRGKTVVPSEKVLRVEFGRKPKEVDVADTSAADDALGDAIAEFQTYLGAVEAKPDKRFPWAAPYARYRLVQLNGVIGNVEGLSAAADELIGKHPDSRYAPLAFVAKAQALVDAGKNEPAKATVEAFGRFIQNKGLTGRWPFEQRLWASLTSGKSGKALEDELADLSADANEYPSVRNRSEVAIGESLVAGKKYDAAEKVFRAIVKDAKADRRTLAAAWTGLGDCLYARAEAASENKEQLAREALMAYMRPVVLYTGESLYVAKAAFWAGRCYAYLPDAEAADRAKKLYRFVIVNFPESRWVREAKAFYSNPTG